MQGRHPRAALVASALLVILLAGCTQGTGPSTSPSMTSPSGQPTFNGTAALAQVKGLALQADGTPRYRMPGTPGQQEGAAYLWEQMAVPGWTRHWQNLTGQDYLATNRSIVAGYGPGSRYCPAGEAERVPGYPFYNLYAIHPSGQPGARLIVLGAHWDSQMHSDNDPDRTKRHLPDPGANDGASGVGVLLQLMRELQGAQLPFDVGVLLLDGEDGFFDCYPLAGSLYFAQHPPVAVDRFLLLDMVGDPQAKFIRETASVASDPKFVDLLWKNGHALGGKRWFLDREASISDDHVAFIQAGVPSVDLIDAGWPSTFPPQWDTSFDTVDRLSPEVLGLVGSTIEATLQDPAFAGSWPQPARS